MHFEKCIPHSACAPYSLQTKLMKQIVADKPCKKEYKYEIC